MRTVDISVNFNKKTVSLDYLSTIKEHLASNELVNFKIKTEKKLFITLITETQFTYYY